MPAIRSISCCGLFMGFFIPVFLVYSMYNDVLAQRAVDRKVNHDLDRFKTKITSLTE